MDHVWIMCESTLSCSSQSKEAVFSVKVDRKSAALTALALKLDGLDEKLEALDKAVGELPGAEAAVQLLQEVKDKVGGEERPFPPP